jgi:phosphoglycolate phosphatase
MKYRMVILDFDGTLADTLPFVLSLTDHLAEKYKVRKIDISDVNLLRTYNAAELMKMHDVPMWKLPMLAAEVQYLMQQNIDQIKMFPGMVDVLRTLHEQKIKIAVVTSNALKNVEKVLGSEIVSLVSYFECGVSLFGKSEKLQNLLRKCAFSAQEVLSVGDEVRDIEAARKSGIPCAAVTWGYSHCESLRGYSPDFILDRVQQILEISS